MRILVLHPGSFGDVLLALPALLSLRAHLPQEEIHWVAQPSFLRLFSGVGLFDTSTSIDAASVSLLFSENTSLNDFSIEKFDMAICWVQDLEETLSKNLRRLGADPVVIHHPLSNPTHRHRSDLFMDSLLPLGIRAVQETRLSPPQKWVSIGNRLLNDWEMLPPIVLHPGAGGVTKRWPSSHFARLGDQIVKHGFQVVLLEGPAEPGLAIEVSKQMVHPSKVASELDLESIAGLLLVSKGFVGNDSGITHLSAALMLPTVVFFKGTGPSLWGPRGTHVWNVTDLTCFDQTLEKFFARVEDPKK